MEMMEQQQDRKVTNKQNEVYGLDDFYENYKRKYPPTMLGEKKGIRSVKISKLLYKKILMEYLDIYFKEVYFLEDKTYFLYGGMFKKVLYLPRVFKQKKTEVIPSSIGFFWYMRGSSLFHYCVRFIKLTGTTNKLPQIEKIYKNGNDINLIPNFETVWQAHFKTKTLYKRT